VKSATSLVADELVECVGQGAIATCAQLLQLAARIWLEAIRDRSAGTWAELANEAPDRLFALRSAALALNGL
jgi:hypothetical protein